MSYRKWRVPDQKEIPSWDLSGQAVAEVEAEESVEKAWREARHLTVDRSGLKAALGASSPASPSTLLHDLVVSKSTLHHLGSFSINPELIETGPQNLFTMIASLRDRDPESKHGDTP